MARVLYLDAGGRPVRWIGLQRAAYLYAKDQVLWDLGEFKTLLRGGYQASGDRSTLRVAPIVAGRTVDRSGPVRPSLSNAALFARDRYTCLYCGQRFPARQLTRDHVMPRSRGGPDCWENVVAACRACNNQKADRTPDESMPLLAVPFLPNPFESILLQGHNIVADQMEYLRGGLSNRRDWSLSA